MTLVRNAVWLPNLTSTELENPPPVIVTAPPPRPPLGSHGATPDGHELLGEMPLMTGLMTT